MSTVVNTEHIHVQQASTVAKTENKQDVSTVVNTEHIQQASTVAKTENKQEVLL